MPPLAVDLYDLPAQECLCDVISEEGVNRFQIGLPHPPLLPSVLSIHLSIPPPLSLTGVSTAAGDSSMPVE